MGATPGLQAKVSALLGAMGGLGSGITVRCYESWSIVKPEHTLTVKQLQCRTPTENANHPSRSSRWGASNVDYHVRVHFYSSPTDADGQAMGIDSSLDKTPSDRAVKHDKRPVRGVDRSVCWRDVAGFEGVQAVYNTRSGVSTLS